eukprot:TRINITY_DN6825_c0_g1_i1.p1 TRINITY_DN6825_c0_g1~~TRINITY_DN6825_c0_g1_i1.p1  ORF type:complete len:190 (-),score=14.57 TRINITY_DN6825_c0_g1_i1:207-776(-)
MGQNSVSPLLSDEPFRSPQSNAVVEKKGIWAAVVVACLLGLLGIMGVERQTGDSSTIISEQSNIIARQEQLIEALQNQVNNLSKLVRSPMVALMQVLRSSISTGLGCYVLGRWVSRTSTAARSEAPVNYTATPASHPTSACAVCLINAKDTVLFPCRHFCLCWECSGNLQQRCPICRRAVESRFFLYNA